MHLRKELPEIFEQFADARKNGFILAKELKEKNIPMVGTFCTYMPQELPLAMGAAVVSLCATSDETIGAAEEDLPRNLCPLIKSSYGFGKTDKCPYFYFSDLVVGETTCDGKKKMYEYLSEYKPMHVMQLPNTQFSDDSLSMWKNEIVRLKQVLEQQFDVNITDEAIKEAIVLKNNERKTLKRFYALGQLDPPAISGQDILKVLYGSTFKFDREANIVDVNALTDQIEAAYKDGKKLESKRACDYRLSNRRRN